MEPQIRFCTATDGTRIGYGVLGEGPPLLVVLSWGNTIETEWENPACRQAYERLAQRLQVVVVMRRGFGPSEREVGDLSLAAQVSDIAAVVDSLDLDSFALWGALDAIGPCVAYCVDNPRMVSKLILWDAYSRGRDVIDDRAARGIVDLIQANWMLATRTFANMAFPSGPPEDQRWLARQFRQSIAPETAARYFEFLVNLDLREYLPKVEVPTLILHRRGDHIIPVSAGRAVAAMIPNSRFVTLDGDVAYGWLGDTSYLERAADFLAEGRPEEKEEPESQSSVRTILFTDLADHTVMMQRLGDAKGREVLREHERITRETLTSHSGTEIKAMGDGFMASFGSAQKALECAIALQRAFEGTLSPGPSPIKERGEAEAEAGEVLRLHIGVNAGEPIAEDDDLFGSSVILAARAASKATAGQILVTNVVRELVAGKGFMFTDRGEMEMKGFEEPVRLFEVRWQEGAG